MTRKQLTGIYASILFVLIWGFDLLEAVKTRTRIPWKDAFTYLHFTELVCILTAFLLVRWVFRRYYTSGRYLLLVAGILFTAAAFMCLRYFLQQVIGPAFFNSSNYSHNAPIRFYILDNIYFVLIYLSIGTFVFFADNQVSIQQKQLLLIQQNRDAELQFLRSQVNPHFLFNTLNNIYSLVYEKSDKAPGAMLQLSGLMRYVLYEKKETVSLEKEWNYILSFIDLQKLRFDHPLQMEIVTEGDLAGKQVAPYLLIPFIENAFKHGNLKDEHSPLSVKLTATGNAIHFRVQNKTGHQQKDGVGGIGLENIKRRLALIYPGKHTLQTVQTDDHFDARLYIEA